MGYGDTLDHTERARAEALTVEETEDELPF